MIAINLEGSILISGMNKQVFIPARYIYIGIGSLTTIIFIVVFLLTFSNSQALEEDSSETAILGTQVFPSGAPVLEEKVIKENKRNSGVTSIEPVTISHTVKEGDSIASIAKAYQADTQTIVDYPYNKISDDFELEVGQIIIIPAGIIGKYTLENLAPGSGIFDWPIKGQITQLAFWWHPGSIDIDLNIGDPVKAAKDGFIVETQELITGYGKHIIIDHGDGYKATYAHLSRIDVIQGQNVLKGETVGLGGSTGRSTGPHLHFEVTKYGEHQDPMTLLK